MGHQKRRQKRALPFQFLWWALGFGSALSVFGGFTLWMASAVYSELPNEANLGPSYQPTDVIVCLTGGRGRIRRALELHAQGKGKILYISGIDKQVPFNHVLEEINWKGPVHRNRLILENISTNTIENAEQVAKYLKEQNLKRILIVTSFYHARRAYYIFNRLLPRDTVIEMTWVEPTGERLLAPGSFDRAEWWKSSNGIWVTMSEFLKFFYTYLRLTF